MVLYLRVCLFQQVKFQIDSVAIFLKRVKQLMCLLPFFMEKQWNRWTGSCLWLEHKDQKSCTVLIHYERSRSWLIKSWYLVSIGWVTVQDEIWCWKTKTPNDPQLKTSLTMCATASNRFISWNHNRIHSTKWNKWNGKKILLWNHCCQLKICYYLHLHTVNYGEGWYWCLHTDTRTYIYDCIL